MGDLVTTMLVTFTFWDFFWYQICGGSNRNPDQHLKTALLGKEPIITGPGGPLRDENISL